MRLCSIFVSLCETDIPDRLQIERQHLRKNNDWIGRVPISSAITLDNLPNTSVTTSQLGKRLLRGACCCGEAATEIQKNHLRT